MFNHGDDLEKSGDTCELIYREVDQFKPQSMVCGSHHMVLLSKQGPRNKYLDLSSVMLVSPRGSTIPLSLYEDLKVNFPNLAVILQVRWYLETYYRTCAIITCNFYILTHF